MNTPFPSHRLLILILLAPACTAQAEDAQPDVKFATLNSDKTNYLSDRVEYKMDTHVVVVDTTSAAQTATSACLPANTSLKGRGKAELSKLDGQSLPSPKPMTAFTVQEKSDRRDAESRRCTSTNTVREGDLVLIDPGQLETMPPHRFGWTYGTLIVPYKYQLRGNREFTGSASLGGYLGYREARTGWALQYIGFAGASSVTVNDAGTDGQPVSRNLTAFSYGLGVLATIKNEFQLGLVLGVDKTGKSANYVNSGKPWVALSLGYAFSN